MPQPTRGTIMVGVAFIDAGPRVSFTIDGHERLLGAKAASVIGESLLRAAAVADTLARAADVFVARDFDPDEIVALLDEMSNMGQDYPDDHTQITFPGEPPAPNGGSEGP